MSGKWRVFPFTALVGQEKIKRALLANAEHWRRVAAG